jgi:hypothetical protein
MAANVQLRDIKVGAWEFFLGATSIGLLANQDVNIEVDANLIKSQVMASGEATAKLFTGGSVPKITLTLAHEHKTILRQVYAWMTGRNLSLTNGQLGSLDFNSAVGDVVPDFVLTGYCNHWDDDGNFYGNDALNPHSVQLFKAYSADAMKWAFSASDNSSHEITFEGKADLDRAKNNPGTYGFISLPLAGVVFANVTAGGTLYASAPVVTVGTQWAATTAYTLNQQIASGGNLYTVSTAGTSGASAPNHTSGAVANGTATLTYVGPSAVAQATISAGGISSIQIVTRGTGYTSAPTIAFTGGGGSGATAVAQIG